MKKALFGPAGNSKSFYDAGYKHSWQMPQYLKDMNLGWYEYSCGKGIRIRKETAERIRTEADAHGIGMSVHAPYYINLANPDPEKRNRSREYIYQTMKVARQMGAGRVVMHTGSTKGKDRTTSLELAVAELQTIVSEKNEMGYSDIILCPETLGKINQLGSLEEIITMCSIADELYPTVDFGHVHSRGNGSIKTQEDYAAILDKVENALGSERMRGMHAHFSHQEYTEKGERRHLTFEDTLYGPFFEPLSKEIVARKMHPVVVCESRDVMAEDAAEMQRIYERDLAEAQS